MPDTLTWDEASKLTAPEPMSWEDAGKLESKPAESLRQPSAFEQVQSFSNAPKIPSVNPWDQAEERAKTIATTDMNAPAIPFSKLVADDIPGYPKFNAITAIPRSIARGILSVPEFATTPVGALAAGVAPLAPALVSGAFALDMGRNLIKELPELKKQWPEMTLSQKIGAVSDTAIQAAFATVMGAHAGKGAGKAIGKRLFTPKEKMQVVKAVDEAMKEPEAPAVEEPVVAPVAETPPVPTDVAEADAASRTIVEPKITIAPEQPAVEPPPAAPGATAKTPQRITPAELTKEIASEPDYIYHATNEERLQEIADDGKLKTHRPDYGTDQEVWPDGSSEKRSYFSSKAGVVWQFSPEEGKPVVIRTKGGADFASESTGDIFSRRPVPANRLEYLGEDGAWHPVSELRTKQPVPAYISPEELMARQPKAEPSESVAKMEAEDAEFKARKPKQTGLELQKEYEAQQKAKPATPAETGATAQKMPFEVDEQLVMHSPHSGEDTIVSYRGKPENGKAMIWSGKMQYAVPESWLRRQGEKYEGQIQPVVEIPSVAKVETPLPAASEVRTELQPASRLSKTELIDELSGQEPSYFEGKMNWKNSRKGLAKNTKQELVDMVDSDRKSKAEFETLKSETSKVYPEIDEMAKAAGKTWKTAIRERAEKEGVAVPNLQNERSDAVYALSQNIASRRIRAAKPAPAAPADLAGPGSPKLGVVSDWTSATEEPTQMSAGIRIPKFANIKMSPLDKVTASHSAKLQKSMSESRRAQSEIQRAVPSDRRQGAISVWREAKGDMTTLQSWADTAKGKVFKQAATDAQSLTHAELAIAAKAGAAFDVLYDRGIKYDVLHAHRDDYVPHVWDVPVRGTGWGGRILQNKFKFAKARTFDTFFDGDQAGFKPKTLAIGKLLPAYIHSMNKVIADRQFVKDMAIETAKDARPLVSPRGSGKAIGTGTPDEATIVFPKTPAKDTSDYRVMEGQPALVSWKWLTNDPSGNSVLMQSDLALHPDAYRRITAMLGQSALRSWYREEVGGTQQIPRAIIRGLDTAQSTMKREMFGLLAPFHQVQEGTHAIGHVVNPFFNIPKVDLRDAGQMDAARHGLMLLPDKASAAHYLAGVGTHSSFISQALRKIPKVGKFASNVIDGYQDYLFHQYIPGLKYKTYVAMLGRNMKTYAPELASGEMTLADVKLTTAVQANAAYGHLNYALLDRNPTMQHIIQTLALAPDFFEARTRFASQGVKGITSKVGHEQMKAIGILSMTMAATAFTLSQLLGGEYDPKHPFELVYKGRKYFMRSVPEDLIRLGEDVKNLFTGGTKGVPFISARINPTLQTAIQFGTGRNYRGEQVTLLDTLEEWFAKYIPITARQIPGLRDLTSTSRNAPTSPLEQLAGSFGLKISRHSPISEAYSLAADWMKTQKIDRPKGVYPVSKYQQLRYALEDGDMDKAKTEYDALLKTETPNKLSTGFRQSITHPFTGKQSTDSEFYDSLNKHDRAIYDLAIEKRGAILDKFMSLGYFSFPTQ